MNNTVSVIVPCRNERGFIAAFCDSLFAQQLPAGWQLQAVIADGQSDDGTAEWLSERAAADARLRVIDNPGRIVSTGLNRALSIATGEVIVRMDVHTVYASDYVAECIATLQRTGADNVGGPWVAVGEGAMQQAICAVFQSRWISGGARSRLLDYEGEADTVYLGAWPRESFARFGGFDEALVRNQDDEHNLRIHQGGGKVWQSARIRSQYTPRGSLSALCRQYLQYGYWKPFVMKKHGQPASLRHLVPGLFVLALLASLLLLPLSGLPLAALLAAYGAVLLLATASLSGQGAAVLLRAPAVIAGYHLSYGLGSVLGWVDVLRGVPAEQARQKPFRKAHAMSLNQIEQAYAKRAAADPRYHPLNPVQLQALQERERVLAALLRRHGLADTASLRLAELGCGGGHNLVGLMRLGFLPQHLRGVELLPERHAAAQALLPASVSLLQGDARTAPIAPASQDLVLLATVLSSVLDDGLQQQLAAAAWRWLRPGGLLICYDFAFNNPANRDVRAVPVARVRQLWPEAAGADVRRLTLAPPLARRLPAVLIAPVNACLPWLRTHRLVALRKA